MVTEMQTLLAHVRNTSLERLATNEGTGDPALVAASHRHTAAVETLLSEEQGLGLTAVDIEGNTAVHLASRLGDVDTLRVLHKLRTGDIRESRGLNHRWRVGLTSAYAPSTDLFGRGRRRI